MIDLSNAPMTLNLKTSFPRVRVGLVASALGKGKIVAVVIQNTFNNIDLTSSANALTLRIGDAAGQTYQLLPGATSPVIYASDLEEIYVRVEAAVAGISTLYPTLIVYKQRT